MTLREKVEKLLPGWKRWYPSLFDAASDLGLIRARVCPPDSLLLSNRHASIQRAAERAHRKQWGVEDEEPENEQCKTDPRFRRSPKKRRV